MLKTHVLSWLLSIFFFERKHSFAGTEMVIFLHKKKVGLKSPVLKLQESLLTTCCENAHLMSFFRIPNPLVYIS